MLLISGTGGRSSEYSMKVLSIYVLYLGYMDISRGESGVQIANDKCKLGSIDIIWDY